MDLNIVRQAGLSNDQFAQLVGVSRITVSSWVNQRSSPRPRLRAHVVRALQLLSQAVAEGALPVPPRTAAIADHIERIAAALRSEG